MRREGKLEKKRGNKTKVMTVRQGTMTLDKTESTSGIESANRKGNFVRQKAHKRGRKTQKLRIVIHVREGSARE